MRRLASVTFVLLLLSCELFARPSSLAGQTQTFHIKGRITDRHGAVVPDAKVAFVGEKTTKSVSTNVAGLYEAELPFGSYIMTAQFPGFRTYRRPLFRVTSPAVLNFDVAFSVLKEVYRITVSGPAPSGARSQETHPPNASSYYGEDFFPIPAKDGTPFQIYISYLGRNSADGVYTYTGGGISEEDPIFCAVDLMSLEADRVVFFEKSHRLEATGHVIVTKADGTIERADSIKLSVDHGSAVELP